MSYVWKILISIYVGFWNFDGTIIDLPDNDCFFFITLNYGYWTLFQPGDTGRYRCIATNLAGKDTNEISLRVQGKVLCGHNLVPFSWGLFCVFPLKIHKACMYMCGMNYICIVIHLKCSIQWHKHNDKTFHHLCSVHEDYFVAKFSTSILIYWAKLSFVLMCLLKANSSAASSHIQANFQSAFKHKDKRV